jgi:uncharacterized protein YggE
MASYDVNMKDNVLSVTGYGRLFVVPNYLKIYMSMGCRSNSMKTSLEGVNGDMKLLFEIVDNVGVERKLVHIVNLDFGPQYEYKNNVKQFLGYDVEQKVDIELDVSKENEDKATRIVGELTSLRYLKSCKIEYGLKNKKKYLESVRELSFKDALEKAEQYAKLAGVRIIKINTIIDSDATHEYSRSGSRFDTSGGVDYDPDSYLPNGQKIVLVNQVDITFDIGI